MIRIIKLICLILGWSVSKITVLHSYYKNYWFSHKFHGRAQIKYPFVINGIDNIICGESVSIGVGATLFCTRAKIVIKGHFVSGPHLNYYR